MNLFWLHRHVDRNAQMHVDRHVVKMILETAQLLYTVLWHVEHPTLENAPKTKSGARGYKATHKNHPCAKWVRASTSNYRKACRLGLALCREYTYRYGKRHACEVHLRWLFRQKPALPHVGRTRPALAMPDEFKCDDVVQSYRNYYQGAKANLAKWTKRDIPSWWTIKTE